MMAPEHEDLLRYAKYPFLKGSGECAKNMGVDLNALVTDRAFQSARLLGMDRAGSAVRDGKLHPPVLSSSIEMLQELLSYPVARMVISCTADKYVIKRYSLAEAERARQLLLEESGECILEMAGELGLDAENPEINRFSVHFADYLRNAAHFKSKEWKLVNQRWHDRGKVMLSKERFTRLLQNSIQDSIESSLPLPVGGDVKKAFGGIAAAIKEEAASRRKNFEASDVGRVSIMYLPPCMKQLLARMQAGENLPHSGRFAITAFLHCLGMNNDDILKAFSLSPDFEDKIARYQVEHISGVGSGTEYTPPGCATMKTYGLCPGEDDVCAREWMDHPLKYYRYRSRKARQRGKEKKDAEKGSGDGKKSEGGK